MTSLINRHITAYTYFQWLLPFAQSVTQVCDWQEENVHVHPAFFYECLYSVCLDFVDIMMYFTWHLWFVAFLWF